MPVQYYQLENDTPFSVRGTVGRGEQRVFTKKPFYSNSGSCVAKIRTLKKRTRLWQKKLERKTTVGTLENVATVRTVHSEIKTFRTRKHALTLHLSGGSDFAQRSKFVHDSFLWGCSKSKVRARILRDVEKQKKNEIREEIHDTRSEVIHCVYWKTYWNSAYDEVGITSRK